MNQLQKNGYICHPQQIYSVRRMTVSEGKAKGMEVIEVCTAGGLQVDILPDAGLDIGQVRFRGLNMSFISKNGYDSPAAIAPYETEFLNTFPGGLLYTCGLRSTGGAHRDGDEWHPLHGRYHSLQAEQVCAEVEGDTVVIKGTLRETALFGHNLQLKRTIRIPVHMVETINRLIRTQRQLVQTLGREPSPDEVAAAMEIPVERVREVMKISMDPVSLETPIGEEEDSHLGDFIQDEQVMVPADAATYTLLREQLTEVLETLTEREQKVLRLRFGLDDGRPRTLEEVGRDFNVTRERIRQIEAKALRKLRHPSRSRKLKDYLDL